MYQEKESTSRFITAMKVLSVSLCALNIVFILLITLYLTNVIPYVKYFLVICILGSAVCLFTSVFTSVRATQTIKKRVVSVSIFLVVWGFFVSVPGIFKVYRDGNDRLSESRRNETLAHATMQYAMDEMRLSPENFRLFNEKTDEMHAEFYDKNKTIGDKFCSLDYKHIGEGYLYEQSETVLECHNLQIIFSKDFSGIIIRYHNYYKMYRAGYYDAANSYSIRPEDGTELKEMIDNVIDSQIAEYNRILEEAPNKMSFSDMLSSLDTCESEHLIYFRNDDEPSFNTYTDYEHEINKELMTIDPSEFERIYSNYNDRNTNIKVFSHTCRYEWLYDHSDRHFRIVQTCVDVNEGFKEFYAEYKVSKTIDEHIMNFVEDTVMRYRY